MTCCAHYDFIDGHEHVFAVDLTAIRFGRGVLAEIGHDARVLGLERHVKTGIASRALRACLALIDPDVTGTLPGNVVAASGFDVLSHALESYTAKPFTQRAAPERPAQRPMSQGANPWSDVGCIEALGRTGEFLVRAIGDAEDRLYRRASSY